MGKEIDPSDIGKHPDLIKKAQAEMTKMDVLVCGECNGVYHFIEQFQEHKSTKCSKVSSTKDNLETKPVIWAFLLWRASQLNQEHNKDNAQVNAWKLYQTWVKLDEAIKETWIVAGRTIQSFARIGQGNLQEMPVKITKTVVDSSLDAVKAKPQTPIGNRLATEKPAPRQVLRTQSDKDSEGSFNELKQHSGDIKVVKKPILRSPPAKIQAVNKGVVKPGVVVRTALRSIGVNETSEHNIEKILAKRFNPRHKEHEYLIKWENVSHELNTWEPASHLDTCPVLLDTFEKQLARQKEQRLAQAAKQAAQAELDKSEASQEEDDDGGLIKKRRMENVSVAKTLVKSEPARVLPANKPKANGIALSSVANKSGEKSAEVVITSAKDGKPTGIVKKTGVTVNPIMKNEAQVKVIPKGGDSVSGVVRLTNQPNKQIQQLGNTTVKPIQSRQSGVTPKAQFANKPTTARSASVQQLTSPKHIQSPANAKPTITRVVKSAPTSKQSTPEQKIAALTRHGDLKITRKSVQPQVQQIIVQQHESEDYAMSEAFQSNITEVQAAHIQSAQGDLALCPITGNILGQVDGGTMQLAQHVTEVKQEIKSENIGIASEQMEQGAAAAFITDQDGGLQQILTTGEDGQEQLIQFVTGEDGTIYQVAGKNEQGQTVLIAQGADGEQIMMVAAEEGDALGMDDGTNGLGGNMGGEVHQTQLMTESGEAIQFADADAVAAAAAAAGVTQPLTVAVAGDDTDSQDGQITAEVVQADEPSPGGTRRVVLQLPDGTFMVTEVDEEQFKALNMQT